MAWVDVGCLVNSRCSLAVVGVSGDGQSTWLIEESD